jgi:hypothetical protein
VKEKPASWRISARRGEVEARMSFMKKKEPLRRKARGMLRRLQHTAY